MNEIKTPTLPVGHPIGERGKVNGINREFFSRATTYEYQMILENELFPKSLFRDRNFSFKVCIVDQEGRTVENKNKVLAKIQLFTAEHPPKQLVTNTAGKTILRGNYETTVNKGVASFEKVRISEVTSHLPRGWISMVISPVESLPTAHPPETEGEDLRPFIDPTKIKPLVLERVLVKAKKDSLQKTQTARQ
eukprot:TRINITY_DN3463_c0_g1_i3.p1 TRINITY_DN3463_c0_g1~~TRINITY_DN3463_c0_g1_i3.p1  ORF type:complete len:192 (+),score=22.38 TRINITY_DN3463_c0_g1_i3:558-1133(+)